MTNHCVLSKAKWFPSQSVGFVLCRTSLGCKTISVASFALSASVCHLNRRVRLSDDISLEIDASLECEILTECACFDFAM